MNDVEDLNQMGAFVNRSFIISLAAILEEYNIIHSNSRPDRSKNCWSHVQLIKRLRNHFAHGDWEYNPNDGEHKNTRALLEEILPDAAKRGDGFITSIDSVLEPLKEGALAYIRASQ